MELPTLTFRSDVENESEYLLAVLCDPLQCRAHWERAGGPSLARLLPTPQTQEEGTSHCTSTKVRTTPSGECCLCSCSASSPPHSTPKGHCTCTAGQTKAESPRLCAEQTEGKDHVSERMRIIVKSNMREGTSAHQTLQKAGSPLIPPEKL